MKKGTSVRQRRPKPQAQTEPASNSSSSDEDLQSYDVRIDTLLHPALIAWQSTPLYEQMTVAEGSAYEMERLRLTAAKVRCNPPPGLLAEHIVIIFQTVKQRDSFVEQTGWGAFGYGFIDGDAVLAAKLAGTLAPIEHEESADDARALFQYFFERDMGIRGGDPSVYRVNDFDYYSVLCFGVAASRQKFMQVFDLQRLGAKYLDGLDVASAMRIALPPSGIYSITRCVDARFVALAQSIHTTRR